MTEPRDGVVTRAFAVLGCFDDRHAALSLAELTRRVGLPVNTVLRLARNLVSVGALERGEDGRFTVGLRMFEIAALAPRGLGLRRAAMPFMSDLQELTGQHVLLTVRENDEAVLIERLSPRGPTGLEYRIGGRMPLSSTGGGLILLAFAPSELRDQAIAAVGPDEPLDGLYTAEDLRRRLAEIRLTGAMTGSRTRPRPLHTAAAPVRDATDNVVAALSVVAHANSIDTRTFVPALVTIARAISRDAFPPTHGPRGGGGVS